MDNVFDIIIIGAGPSGLTAALYAKRSSLNVLIIEKSTPGGQLININKIHNYPGYMEEDGASLAYNMYKQVVDLNVDFVFDEVIDVSLEDNLKIIKTMSNTIYKAKNIIVATGTTYASLKLANERKYIGKGISYCAVCDGKLYTNKDIAVVANNEHSLKETLYLTTFAKHIYLLSDVEIEKNTIYNDIINNNKISIIKMEKIVKLFGDDYLNSIDVLSKENQIINLQILGLFVLTSSLPSNTFLNKYAIFASNGYMNVNEHFESNIKGIYGVGDVINKDLRQVVTACSDGAIAAQYIVTHK